MYKILVIGGDKAGKSSLINRYTDDIFTESYLNTVEFKIKTVDDDLDIKQQIWRVPSSNNYYKGANAIILCLDVTDSQSLEEARQYLNNCQRNAPNAPVIIVGTKTDKENERQISSEQLQQFVTENQKEGSNVFGPVETSSKNGNNIDECFELTVRTIKQIMFEPRLNKIYEIKKGINNDKKMSFEEKNF